MIKNNYINIYNNIVNLTRNKKLYSKITNNDTFSDRLIIFLFHFAFLLKVFKNKEKKSIIQKVFDSTFKQLELSIRELGYGDMSINKKMKEYVNLFYAILDKIENWENLEKDEKMKILHKFLSSNSQNFLLYEDLSIYFEKYRIFLSNITLNLLIKSVIKEKF
tara:strand:- start:62 stop:550 length:489 start_codon:yes stop_codon:yes gene_type:complete